MSNLVEELKKIITGIVLSDADNLKKYSRDTSLFSVKPEVVVCPKDVSDLKRLVKFVGNNKKTNKDLSLTARSAGTDMTGGPLGESIIVSFTENFNQIKKIDAQGLIATVEPGVYFRDFEKKTIPLGVSLPTYPASKSIAAIGGMIANNAGGEKSLRYGKTNKFIKELKVVLADGNEYVFRSLSKKELEAKKGQNDFEGEIYRQTSQLLTDNFEKIKQAEPKVAKNSAGYALWQIWDKENFDLTQLFCGAQGTLGLITEATVRLVPDKPKRRTIALFFKNWQELPNVINDLLPYQLEGLETFDDATLKLGLRFMPQIAKRAGTNFLTFALRFLPEALISLQLGSLPKLIVLVQLAEDTDQEINTKVNQITVVLNKAKVKHRVLSPGPPAEKYWIMRRQSFALLRENVKGKQTAPFVEDFCIRPELIPQFLPQAVAILQKNGIAVNIAGHAGEGNFHIIPLMDLSKQSERDKIMKVADQFYDLVIKYEGTITAEHNDGIIRTPYLKKMYGPEIYDLFGQIKKIFDPQNIFNPGKKVGGSIEYAKEHISSE